jgi:hypothetical protein
MSNKEIKEEIDQLEKQIEKERNRIIELRNICTHENTLEGLYSWRVGVVDKAIICSDCGQFIKFVQ